jgi:hypothetical protein
MKVFAKIAIALAVILSLCVIDDPAQANGFKKQFTDSLDGNFDLTKWLDQAYGFMPIVSLITEPAVGFGVAGGIVFIHRPVEERGKPLTSPPSMSGAMGFYTENESWGGGAFYEGHWRKDKYRYMGFLGYVSMNLTYFPPALSEQGIGFDFNIEGGGLVQRLLYRIKRSPWFVGAEYSYFKNTVEFKPTQDIPGFDGFKQDFHLGDLGAIGLYDTRDYNFTTNLGLYSQAKAEFYAPVFGSDYEFQKYSVYGLGWRPYKSVVFGLRLDGRFSSGEVPFFSKPFVKLRGIPAMRYQDDYAVVVETEERWDISRRWAVDGFVGLGKAYGGENSFSDAELVYSVGGGFRYLLARQYNLYGGIDVARGPEQWAIYIVVGQWWNGL